MKARVWFEAQGQSLRARGFSWPQVKVRMNLYALPLFAQRALARGHLNAAKRSPEVTEQDVEKAWQRFEKKMTALRAPDGVAIPDPHTFPRKTP